MAGRNETEKKQSEEDVPPCRCVVSRERGDGKNNQKRDDFETVQRPSIAAAPAFDPESCSKSRKIGGGADVLCRHSLAVATAERFGNKRPC
jgi:hypothetical protein